MAGIDRRELMKGAGLSALSVLAEQVGLSPRSSAGQEASTLHPLTWSLLERARLCRVRERFDRRAAEVSIRGFAEATSVGPLMIEWTEDPNGAFYHLCRLGLNALLRMGDRAFWSRDDPSWATLDGEAFDRAFPACALARDLLGADEADRLLVAPKLALKERASSAGLSSVEAFRLRATAAQVGWLETSMSEAAAQAVGNVEALLSEGAAETSELMYHQLMVFEARERGLLATWEIEDRLICLPVQV